MLAVWISFAQFDAAAKRVGAQLIQCRRQRAVERVRARVGERCRHRAVDRHGVDVLIECLSVALNLLFDITDRVACPAAIKLVDRHDVGVVQHVDLLELALRAKLRRHDIERQVGVFDDLGIALPDAAALEQDEIEATELQHRERILNRVGQRYVGASRRHRPHEHPFIGGGVHANAVAEQRAAGLAPRGVNAQHRDAILREVEQTAPQQFVDQRTLAGAAGAGDAENGWAGRQSVNLRAQWVAVPLGERFDQRDRRGDSAGVL